VRRRPFRRTRSTWRWPREAAGAGDPKARAPRSTRAHASILQAAVELLVRDGYQVFSMQAVAARAGVGKATIYHRWSSKDELLKEAIASLNATSE